MIVSDPFEDDQCEGFFVAIPFIDGGHHGDGELCKIPWSVFKGGMIDAANTWGERGVGRRVINGEQPARTDTDFIVLAIGRFADRKFAIVSGQPHDDDLLIEYDWNDEWNVTNYA